MTSLLYSMYIVCVHVHVCVVWCVLERPIGNSKILAYASLVVNSLIRSQDV